MKKYPSHKKTLDALKRIEGQVRGIQRMVEEKRYCVDILTQLSAVGNAVASVQDNILNRHLDTCVVCAVHFYYWGEFVRFNFYADLILVYRRIQYCRLYDI